MDEEHGHSDEDGQREFLRRVFDELIRPQLKQLAKQMGGIDPEDLEDAEIDITQLGMGIEALDGDLNVAGGEALLLGGHDPEKVQEVMEQVHRYLREGLSLQYIIQELTDVSIAGMSSSRIGNIRVNMVAIDPRPNEIETPSPEELRDMFEL